MTEHTSRKKIDPRPGSATFFVTCLVDQFRPTVGDAVVEVLEKEGVQAEVPPAQTCCGQPAFNSGYRKEAREVALRFLDVFDQPAGAAQPIVTPSGSCAAMVRNYYPVLFRDEPDQLERVGRVSERLWEFSEFLVDGLGVINPQGSAVVEAETTDEEKSESAVTYHKCCHALRELGIDRQPTALVDSVAGDTFAPMVRSEVCCGFGGSFSVKMADISTAMLSEKLDNAEATGANTLVAGDTGCIMHMEGGLRRRGSQLQVLHIAEFLARSRRSSAETSTNIPEHSAAPIRNDSVIAPEESSS